MLLLKIFYTKKQKRGKTIQKTIVTTHSFFSSFLDRFLQIPQILTSLKKDHKRPNGKHIPTGPMVKYVQELNCPIIFNFDKTALNNFFGHSSFYLTTGFRKLKVKVKLNCLNFSVKLLFMTKMQIKKYKFFFC